MNAFKRTFKDIAQYPSAIGGVIIILALVALAVYTVVAVPYDEAIRLWRGGEEVWGDYPRLAPPAWFNFFSRTKQPTTIVRNSTDGAPFVT